MLLGVPWWLPILLLSLGFVAASPTYETCPSSQGCTEGAVVETCADGEGGWSCGKNMWLPDNTFHHITDGECTQKGSSYFLCGQNRVHRSLYNAALMGRCLRACKKTSRIKACDCPLCTLDSFSCSFEGETTEMKADMFRTLHSRSCFIQRHHRTRRESIVCASTLGEVKTTLETFMAATRGDCAYKCSHEAPNKLDSCASTVMDPIPIVSNPDTGTETDVPVLKEGGDHLSDFVETKHPETQTIKAPSPSIPSPDEKPQNLSTVSDQPVSDKMITNAEVESTIEVPTEGPAPSQTIAEPSKEPSIELAEPDVIDAPGPLVEVSDVAEGDRDQTPIAVGLATNSSDTLDLKTALLEPTSPSSQNSRAKYTTGGWGGCSVTCGVGVQERSVSCILLDDPDQSVPMEICRGMPNLGSTPASTRQCVRPQCEEFTPIVTGTSQCSNTCGPSLERQSLICASNYGRTVSLEKCGLTMPKIGSLFGKEISFETTASLGRRNEGCDKEINMGVKAFVEMSHKSSIFNGRKERPETQCENTLVIKGALVDKCEALECGNRVWTVARDWSECTETCGGGIKTREIKCYLNGREVSDSRCPGPKPITTKACNTAKCQEDLVYWVAGSWSDCDKECIEGDDDRNEIQYGRRYRDVTCVSVRKEVLDDNACGTIPKPSSQSTCAVKRCDFCDVDQPCNGRGTCGNLRCECFDGYGGERCEYGAACKISDDNLDCCPSTVVDDAGKCCESGLVGNGGRCCDAGQVLDKDGHCCAEALDACGVCGGSAIRVDALGDCCDGQVDASGICCLGLVDECGVCEGAGTSCDTELKIAAAVNPGKRGAIKKNIRGAQSVILQAKLLRQLSTHLGIEESFIHFKRLVGETMPLTTTRRLLDHPEGDIEIARSGSGGELGGVWMKDVIKAVKEISRPSKVQARVSAASWFDGGPARVSLPHFNRRAGQLEKQDPGEKPGTSTATRVLLQAPDPTPQLSMQEPNVRSTVVIDGEAGLPFSQLHNSLMGLEGNVTIFTEDKVGVCGNGICELNERPVMNGDESDGCPVDCMVPLIHPPATVVQGRSVHCSGRGKPLFVSGTCQCYAGYSGDACEACQPGFIRLAGGKPGEFQCVKNFSPSVPLLSDDFLGDVSSVKPPDSASSSGDRGDIGDTGETTRKSAKAGPTTLALIGFLVAVAVLGALALVVIFFRRQGDGKGKEEERQDRDIPVIAQQEPDLESGLPASEDNAGHFGQGGLPDNCNIDFLSPRTNSTASGSGDEAAISIGALDLF
ncbi:hypothetical protein BSKO_02251 [Bryopsis sp. KO-2023]|nr:hypothetical protein BSKO_02251 [Bryopsis sp. KO-2023]